MSTDDRMSGGAQRRSDLAGADAALLRAARRARREAAAAGCKVVVFRDGGIVWEEPGREYLPHGQGAGGNET